MSPCVSPTLSRIIHPNPNPPSLHTQNQAAYLIMSDCQTFPPNIIKAYFYYIVSLLCLFMRFFIKDNFFKKKGDKDKKSGKDSSPDTPTRTTRSKAKAN